MLFCDLSDYTALTEACDPEEAAALWRHVEALATRTIVAFGGAISQCYGDGILAVFGLPESSEEDVRRSVDAALELRRLMHEQGPAQLSLPPGFALGMHFGIHAGVVLVHAGDSLHGRYQLTGDAVNTTARLCGAAQRDEIVVSEEALRSIVPLYQAEPLAELTLKGKRVSVPAYRVHSASGVTRRFEVRKSFGLTAFEGRAAELARVRAALSAVAGGGTRVLRLWGPAGIGKTRLLDQLARGCAPADALVLRGYCDGYGNPPSLQPFTQILRQLLGLRAETTDEQAVAIVEQRLALLGDEVVPHVETFLRLLSLRSWPDPGRAVDAKRAITDAVAALFTHLRSPHPLLLVIDDWQWADDLSKQALRTAIENVVGYGLLVVLGSREAQVDPLLVEDEAIELKPLQLEESSRVIKSLMPNELDIGLSEALHQRSGGNPLFLEELCRSLPSDLKAGPEVLDRTGIPHELHAVIQARLSRLPADALRLLKIAAVCGNELDVKLLEHVSREEDVGSLLCQLESHDLIRRGAEPGASYRFKHGITREVVYESVLRAERRALHHAIARALEDEDAARPRRDLNEVLAHHFVGSGEHERAVHHAELAGDRAAAASSLDRARIQYRTGLYELDRLPPSVEVKRRWLHICEKWARVLVYNPVREQVRLLERAARYAEELSDLAARADVAQLGSMLCYALGDYKTALEHCEAGLQIVERAQNNKLVGQLLSNMGQAYAAAGRYREGLDYLDRALQLKQTTASEPRSLPVGFAYALACKALVHAEVGQFELAYRLFDEAVQTLRKAGHPVEGSVHGLLAVAQLWQGRWSAAIESCAHASATAARVDFRYVIAISQAMSAYARYMQGGSREALEALQRAVSWLQASERGLLSSCCYAWLADALQRDGQAVRALEYAERALRRSEEMDPLGEPLASRAVARQHASEGAFDAAADALARAERAANARGSVRELALTRLAVAELRLRRGEREAAQAMLEPLRAELAAMGMSDALAQLERSLGGGG